MHCKDARTRFRAGCAYASGFTDAHAADREGPSNLVADTIHVIILACNILTCSSCQLPRAFFTRS